MKRIGILTSGGDSPGMNAAIRSATRVAISRGVEMFGIMRGYQGMIEGDFVPLDRRAVAGIIGRGGTILKTARSKEFMKPAGRARAHEKVRGAGLEGLVVIGGDGSFRGAYKLSSEFDIPVIGVPGSIDNDSVGTDSTIGFDTAVNIALEAIDRIRDTASSHDRVFFIEVMGRSSGFIALHSGLCGGAEAILIPEVRGELNELAALLKENRRQGKLCNIVVVAEGEESGGAFTIANMIKTLTGLDFRVTILGHIQRGGIPTAADRLLATRLGAAAAEALLDGKRNVMAGVSGNDIVLTPFEQIWDCRKEPDLGLLRLAKLLS
ncbi:MAG: 6-phosphofructokinase [Euryarchaeota archaeon]|nr:6-phosphofructokinase [Euryarchaeota archaeon]